MGWIRITRDHKCELPHGWSAHGTGSVWECPDCHQMWKITAFGSSGGMAERISFIEAAIMMMTKSR